MPWYLRRAARFGPFRLNVSKSGLGLSAGVRGLRVGTSPRGTYVHMGRGGLYYHRRLGSPSAAPVEAGAGAAGVVASAPVEQLADSSAEETLALINARLRRLRLAPWAWLLTTLLVWAAAGVQPAGPLVSLVLVVGAALAGWTHVLDRGRRTTSLEYDLDGEAERRWAAIARAVDDLAASARVWRVLSQQETADWKRHAGATGLVGRQPAEVGILPPPFIRTNLVARGIRAAGLQLCFFPDRLLVHERGCYGAVAYSDLFAAHDEVHFREDEVLPRDAEVIGWTWRFVRRDGGPDRRFGNNRQLPIVRYGVVDIRSRSGLRVLLDVSDPARAHRFVDAVTTLAGWGLAMAPPATLAVPAAPPLPRHFGRGVRVPLRLGGLIAALVAMLLVGLAIVGGGAGARRTPRPRRHAGGPRRVRSLGRRPFRRQLR